MKMGELSKSSNRIFAQRNHVITLLFVVEIIGTAVKNISVFGVHFHNHITVFALRAFENVVFMNLIVGHEIAHFRVVGTDPQVKTVVFIEFIFQRETADWAT